MVLQLDNEFIAILRLNDINPEDEAYVHTLVVMLRTYPYIPQPIINYLTGLDRLVHILPATQVIEF